LFPELQNNSVIESPLKILDLRRVFGPGQYEDPRILQISGDKAVMVFVRHTDIGSMCVAVLDSKYSILGSIEYKCRQTQKNWMPRLHNGSLYLYARVPDVVYTVPNIATLRNHEVIEISPMASSEWRGSSQVIYLKNRGHIGVLHKRLRPKLSGYFLPGYSFAFYNFDTLERHREFFIEADGFVYVNSIEQHSSGLQVSCGISDCVRQQYHLTEEQLDVFLQQGDSIVLLVKSMNSIKNVVAFSTSKR